MYAGIYYMYSNMHIPSHLWRVTKGNILYILVYRYTLSYPTRLDFTPIYTRALETYECHTGTTRLHVSPTYVLYNCLSLLHSGLLCHPADDVSSRMRGSLYAVPDRISHGMLTYPVTKA